MGDGNTHEGSRTLSFLRLWGIEDSTRTLTVETEREREARGRRIGS